MEFYSSWFTYFIFFLIFLLLGYYILDNLIFESQEVKNWLPILIFCLIFSLSLIYLELLIFEILQYGTEEQRYHQWLITTLGLTYGCLFLIPILQIFNFARNILIKKNFQAVIIMFLSSLYLFYLLNMISQSQENQSEQSYGYRFYFSIKQLLDPSLQIDFITKIGVVLIAIISGFGAVYCPFCFFNFINYNIISISENDISQKIHFILQEIIKSKSELINLNMKLSEINAQPDTKSNFISYIFGQSNQNDKTKIINQIKELSRDIQINQDAQNETFITYCEFIQEKNKLSFSKSYLGIIQKICAQGLSIYCIWKILSSSYNYILGRKKGIDIINRVLQWFMKVNEEQYNIIMNDISFIFMGYLMITNVRSFTINLINFLNLFMSTFLSRIISSDIIIYIVTETLGVYFISTLMLLQTSLPQQYLININKIVGIDIIQHYVMFDLIFILSAFASIFIIFVNEYFKKQKYKEFLKQS